MSLPLGNISKWHLKKSMKRNKGENMKEKGTKRKDK
jgi:hypothetical protein